LYYFLFPVPFDSNALVKTEPAKPVVNPVEPVVANPEPVVAEPEPVVAQPEPEADKPTEDEEELDDEVCVIFSFPFFTFLLLVSFHFFVHSVFNSPDCDGYLIESPDEDLPAPMRVEEQR
jgi:hypothetical protein